MSSNLIVPAPVPTALHVVAAEETPSWKEIYEKHQRWMRSLVQDRIPARLQARFDVDDVVQTVFLAMCTRQNKIAVLDDESVHHYLGEAMLNGLRDQVRHHTSQSRSADQESEESDGALAHSAHADETPLDALERHETHARLVDGLAALTPAERTLVCMRYIDQLSWIEIGAALELPETTVRRHVLAALDRLMQLVG